MRSLITLAGFLTVLWCVWAGRGLPSPVPARHLVAWLRVLACRVVSLSRRDRAPVAAPEEVKIQILAGGALRVSQEDGSRHVVVRQAPRPLPPPAPTAPPPAPRVLPDATVELDAWIAAALAQGSERAHVVREAARLHGCTLRTAQRAAQRVAGGAR